MTTFYENFLDLCNANELSPSAAANEMKLSNAAVNGWKNGKVPRDSTLRKIADYFKVTVDDLLSSGNSSQEIKEMTKQMEYYTNPETAKAAQEMFENPELRVLYDAERTMSPDQMTAVYNMILALKKDSMSTDDTGC